MMSQTISTVFVTTVQCDKRGEANLYGPDRLVESIFVNNIDECCTGTYLFWGMFSVMA